MEDHLSIFLHNLTLDLICTVQIFTFQTVHNISSPKFKDMVVIKDSLKTYHRVELIDGLSLSVLEGGSSLGLQNLQLVANCFVDDRHLLHSQQLRATVEEIL